MTISEPKQQILLIEPHSGLCETAEEILASLEGVDVQSARSADEAWDKLLMLEVKNIQKDKNEHFKYIVTETKLPHGSYQRHESSRPVDYFLRQLIDNLNFVDPKQTQIIFCPAEASAKEAGRLLADYPYAKYVPKLSDGPGWLVRLEQIFQGDSDVASAKKEYKNIILPLLEDRDFLIGRGVAVIEIPAKGGDSDFLNSQFRRLLDFLDKNEETENLWDMVDWHPLKLEKPDVRGFVFVLKDKHKAENQLSEIEHLKGLFRWEEKLRWINPRFLPVPYHHGVKAD